MAIALVQSDKKIATGSSSTTLAFPSNITAGNLLIATQCHFENVGSTVATPTDTRTHTYLPITAEQALGGAGLVRMRSFYVPNCTGGANTVSFVINGSSFPEFAIAISEWSGVKTSSPLFTTNLQGPVTSTTPSSGNISPNTTGSLLYGGLVINANNVSITAGSGWTTLEQQVPAASIPISTIYKLGSLTTEDADWTIGSSVAWLANVGVFLPEPAAALNQPRLLCMRTG